MNPQDRGARRSPPPFLSPSEQSAFYEIALAAGHRAAAAPAFHDAFVFEQTRMHFPISRLGPAERFAEGAVAMSALSERLQELLAIFFNVWTGHRVSSRRSKWLA